MKHLFIVNPTAGGKDKTEQVRLRAEEVFAGREDSYEIYVTKAAMDAPGKIRQAAADVEALRVYACGGDGTFNECVCGAAGLANVAVCPYPTVTVMIQSASECIGVYPEVVFAEGFEERSERYGIPIIRPKVGP